MKAHECYQLVFSSSCTVYGNPNHLPITEDHPIGQVTNVYGRTKYMIEEMLMDLSRSDEVIQGHLTVLCRGFPNFFFIQRWNIVSLRYFNPVGAHPSGRIGEDPTKPFSNLMPYLSQVALGKKPSLAIFGDDYDTPDGTGTRLLSLSKSCFFKYFPFRCSRLHPRDGLGIWPCGSVSQN